MRIDKWLFTVRICKSRSIANQLTEQNKVSCNGATVKASRAIKIGDKIEIKTKDKHGIFEILNLPERRVSATIAKNCFLDESPAQEKASHEMGGITRDRGLGRPTKKDRRDQDDMGYI